MHSSLQIAIFLFFLSSNCCDAVSMVEHVTGVQSLMLSVAGNLSDVLRQLRRYALPPPCRNDVNRDITHCRQTCGEVRHRSALPHANSLVHLLTGAVRGRRESPILKDRIADWTWPARRLLWRFRLRGASGSHSIYLSAVMWVVRVTWAKVWLISESLPQEGPSLTLRW